MQVGNMYLWRFKDKGGIYRFGYVIERYGNMIKTGAYNGAVDGVWVKESEVEYESYNR